MNVADDGFTLVQRREKKKVKNSSLEVAKNSGSSNGSSINISYKLMSIIPTFGEILFKGKPLLKPNKQTGAFDDARDYVETHFRLFHEDFLRPLKTGVQDYIRNQKFYANKEKEFPEAGPIRLYEDVVYSAGSDYVQLQPINFLKVDWEESKLLLPGNLLLLSCDNFVSAYRATVANFRDEKYLERGIVKLVWVDDPPNVLKKYKFTMLESGPFFQYYRYTLQVLQEMKPEALPLTNYIVNSSSDVRPPAYLTMFSKHITLGGKCVVPLSSKTWPESKDLNLNENQFKALKSCMTKEFAIVQGPPGTGKTFVALQFVEILLRNIEMWNPKGQEPAPILVVSFTNHALDQFLEGALQIFKKIGITPRLVRVGGKGESEALESYHISKTNTSAISKAHILGMTTTGAAKYNDLLTKARPRIVVVEEAAEVLESHIIPCLLPNCQHLLLIGDHQQLQPFINVQELSAKYHLDLSLFERMVNNKLHLCTLNVQHRMRPEISDLIVGTIYEDLVDAQNVLTYPQILGMKLNLYFITHEMIESTVPGTLSKVNMYEKKFLVSLCRYMIQQGYSASQITVLAMYNGQVDVLKESLKQDEVLGKVEVTTVDGFQGKENDIILLSLVRSNDEAQIGFLKKNNRVCVALSRAKHGLYIIGNMTQLALRSLTWRDIQKKLAWRSSIGPSLPIQCQIHREIQNIQNPADFQRLAPEGGCLLPCGMQLTCGHSCPSRCHKSNHDDYKCQLNCTKTCPRGHPCAAVCSETCPPCVVPWKSFLVCSHEVPVPCFLSENAETVNRCLKFCRMKCDYLFSEAEGGCGHICQGDCSSCLQGRLHVKCEAECQRQRPCGHKCKSPCFQECPPCEEKCAGSVGNVFPDRLLTNATNSFIKENTDLNRYFPYVKIFIQRKLSETVLNPVNQQIGIKGSWALSAVVDFVQVAVNIVSCNGFTANGTFKTDLVDRFYSFFYTLLTRKFPWSREEIKNSEQEFHRLKHLAQTYYMATLINVGVASQAKCKTAFDRLYQILGTRRAYGDAAQKQVNQFFEELADYLLDHADDLSWLGTLSYFQ